MAGTSILTKPLENLRDKIAASTAWQAWTGKGEEDAKGFIFLRAYDAETVTWPNILLMTGDSWVYEKIAQPNSYWVTDGSILVRFLEKVDNLFEDPESATEEEINQAFDDLAVGVLVEICEEAELVDIQRIRRAGGNRRPAKEQIETYGNLIQGEYEVEY